MDKKPNVLIFFTDDQRYNTIHSLGCTEISTPNLDEFVNDSVTFTNAHIMGGTCGAVCMPSRSMLQTGRDLFALKGQGRENGSIIPEEHITIPEYLHSKGYYAYHIGKWHQDKESFMRSYDNADTIMGFASNWYGNNGGHYQPFLFDYDATGRYEDEKAYNLDINHNKIPSVERRGRIHSTDIFCDAAIDFLNRYNEDKPFYLYLATVAPHDPRNAPSKFKEMYNSESISTPENYMDEHPFDNGELFVRDEMLEYFPRSKQAIRRHLADYYSMISHIDSRFGDVINTLKKNGQYENTIIIYAGDNGLALGSHGLMGKQNLYEESIRVPLIIKPAGKYDIKKTDEFCYLYDLFPTICDLCGFNIPPSVTGMSMKGIIDGTNEKIRNSIFAAYRNIQRCYKEKKYKIIEYYVNGNLTQQLFNLENDPYEMNDLSNDKDYIMILEDMHRKLNVEQERYKDPLVTQDKDILELKNVW